MQNILRNSLVILLVSGCGTALAQGLGSPSGGGISAASAGSFQAVSFQGHTYKLYVPSQAQSQTPLPLVMALHGCTQDPDSFAAATGFNDLAEQDGFYVLYPQQTADEHPQKCWRWFDPADQQRGSGEPALLDAEVQNVEGQYAIDRSSVYVAGFSAGAAMANIMGADYPDTFAAISVNSGLEYKAAEDEPAGQQAMRTGGPDPAQSAQEAYQAMGANKRIVPALIFHGTADYIVNQINAGQEVDQWVKTDELAGSGALTQGNPQQSLSQGGQSYTATTYTDANGQVDVEEVLVDQMSHAWSGGSATQMWTDPSGPNATLATWQFFSTHRLTAGR